jgi:outer membrane lipoprotein-sorting protein
MTDENRRPEPDILEQATGALRDAPVPGGPPPALTAATVAAVQSRLATVRPADDRRRKIMRYVRYSSGLAAAVAVATVAGVLWTPRESAASEFRRAMDKAAQAETMTAHCPAAENGGLEWKIYVRGQQIRCDYLNPGGEGKPDPKQVPVITANIYDLEAQKTLVVFYEKRSFLTLALNFKNDVPDVLSNFRHVKDDAVESLGTEKVGGTKAKVYRVKTKGLIGPLSKADDVRVWIDPATELPVRIRIDHAAAGDMPARVTLYEDFVWGAKLADDLFSLTPPKGFKAVQSTVPRPPEKDD